MTVNSSITQKNLTKKLICRLETDLAKVFKSNQQINVIAAPKAKLIRYDISFIQYEQFSLNDNFRQYVKTSMITKKVFQMGIQPKHPSPRASYKNLKSCLLCGTVRVALLLRSLNMQTILNIKSCRPKVNILLVQTKESISIYEAVEATLASFRNPGFKIELKNVLMNEEDENKGVEIRLTMKYKTYSISKKMGHCRLNS